MKKKLLIAVAVSALTASSAIALTAPGGGVLGSVHDMNVVGNGIQKDAQGRVCAFCHTPHHALDVNSANGAEADYLPLWSHDLTGQSFTQYDSGTYDAGKAAAINALIGPTRLCMSCHDGAIAPDQHYGGPNTGNKFTNNDFLPLTDNPAIGIGAAGALNRTHPIGFDLAAVADADYQGGIGVDGNAFSGSNQGTKAFVDNIATTATYNGTSKKISSQLWQGTYMTCATCHDVHNKDNVPNGANVGGDHPDTLSFNYLVFATQSGSQLCLSCHVK